MARLLQQVYPMHTKNKFKGTILLHTSDLSGHFDCPVVEISNLTCVLVCVYGYNQPKENEAFNHLEEQVLDLLTKYPNAMLIFG